MFGLGGVAQLGERTVRIRKVESSILFVSTISNELTPKSWTEMLNFLGGAFYFLLHIKGIRSVIRRTIRPIIVIGVIIAS